MEDFHTEILDRKRRTLLPALAFLHNDFGLYLAGGTALALQLGHRTSRDFDFYAVRSFSAKRLFQALRKNCGQVAKPTYAEDTLITKVRKIDMSFFRYSYRLLESLIPCEGLYLAAKQDIAAMKLVAITQRGKRRDFVDLYFLLKEYPLKSIFHWAHQKYPEFNSYVGLQGLSYFVDADNDQDAGRFQLVERLSWERVKKTLTDIVRKFKKEELG